MSNNKPNNNRITHNIDTAKNSNRYKAMCASSIDNRQTKYPKRERDR